jgi:hypothetical protein
LFIPRRPRAVEGTIDDVLGIVPIRYVRLGDAPKGKQLDKSKLAIAVILATLLTSHSAPADGYAVDFAVEVGGGQDGGSVKCQFDHLCIVTVEKLRLNFDVSVSRNDRDRALLNVDGNSGCCLLEGAVRTLAVDTLQSPLGLRLFVGRPARGLEFIENRYVGSLYLKFQFSRSLNKQGNTNGNY